MVEKVVILTTLKKKGGRGKDWNMGKIEREWACKC
jgi:hypothetical protein